MKKRVQIQVRGIVQGVGFRPHVFRVAQSLRLSGFVRNDMDGVYAELEGDQVDEAIRQILKNPPLAARISDMNVVEMPALDDTFFEIRASISAKGNTRISPDLACCEECLNEVFEPNNRRFGYPFTNCTNCGPRFSIIQNIPYDRKSTTMAHFKMCDACQAEYDDPANRRFHAQPNACVECGPNLTIFDEKRRPMAGDLGANLGAATAALNIGDIVAVKGIGGFHLMCDARNDEAVRRLRGKKSRPDKPFAVMFRDIQAVQRVANITEAEKSLLTSIQAPIVLVEGKRGIAPAINQIGTRTGAFLAHTPLHHLLMTDLDALVATSANFDNEPMCIHVDELFDELNGVFDMVVDHNRPIARPIEDSVLESFGGHTLFHRFGRGYAIGAVAWKKGPDAMAFGGHLKSALALRVDGEIQLGPQIGNLVGPKARARYEEAVKDLPALLNAHPDEFRCDEHPDYFSTRIAEEMNARPVQHHEAHVAAVMAEHGLDEAFGVAWDGIGYGRPSQYNAGRMPADQSHCGQDARGPIAMQTDHLQVVRDNTSWGGEFFVVRGCNYERSSISPYRVHPGDLPATQPWRSAHAIARILERPWPRPDAVSEADLKTLDQNLIRNGVLTTSMGRLFDGFAALSGLCQTSTFEAHAAQVVQAAAEAFEGTDEPPKLTRGDWIGVMRWALDTDDPNRGAFRFHEGLAALIEVEALSIGEGLPVVLSGGCFQNRMLLRLTIERLRAHDLDVHWPTRFPAGDGGLAVGQVARRFKEI